MKNKKLMLGVLIAALTLLVSSYVLAQPGLVIHVDKDGKVVKVIDVKTGEPKYPEGEGRRIDGKTNPARLATENWCCWVYKDGYWRCIEPCP